MTLILRDYQEAAVDAQIKAWEIGCGHSLIVSPTGSGKALILCELALRLWRDYGARVLIATHVSTLVRQNFDTLQRLAPGTPSGIYHAGIGKRDAGAEIVFAGVHSVYKAPQVLGRRDVLIIDECHLVGRSGSGIYRRLISHFEEMNPGMRVCGLSATPYRLDSGLLTEPYGKHAALFDEIVYEVSIGELIERGYLCPVLPYVSPDSIDLSGVKKTGGDYNKGQLAAAVDKDEINRRVALQTIAAGSDRLMWIVFATSIEHCMHLVELFQAEGIATEHVIGETKERERQRIFNAARSGDIRCLVTVGVGTTGLDIPRADLISMVRPTQSKSLYVQMMGRVMRTSEETGKVNALCLDFAGNTLRHGVIDDMDGSKSSSGAKGVAPARACPECSIAHHASLRVCPGCGHQYPASDIKYIGQSRASAVLSTQQEPQWFDVDQVTYTKHRKQEWMAGRMVDSDAPPSLKITYVCGLITVPHWVAIESERGRALAARWWLRNSLSGDPPESVDEALARIDDLRVPGRVQVTKDGKYNRITSWDYSIEAGITPPAIERAI